HRPDWKIISNPYAEQGEDLIVLLPALSPDFAIFHAAMADAEGNVWLGRRRECATIAHASKRALVTVERVVPGNFLEDERLAAALARRILAPDAPPARHIAVGAASPLPAAACWLVKKLGHPVRLSLLHKRSGNPFTEGTRELFDLTGQGRIDLFFLGGGQID